MPFLPCGEDVRVHYELWPEGKDGWITLLPAYARPVSDYKAMGRYLASRGWRVVAPDLRGAGRAECPPAFDVDDIAGDVLALWDHLGADRSFVFGAGLGGAVAVQLAARAPTRPRGLVLVGTPVSAAHAKVECRSPSRDARRFQGEILRYFSPSFLKDNAPVVQGFLRQVARVFQEPDSALGATCQRAALEALDLSERLAEITAPTLILRGEQDHVVPAEAAAELAKGIRGAQLESWPDTGHLMLAEAPLKLYERIDVFCRSAKP